MVRVSDNVNGIISFQNLVGSLDKMTIANLCRQHHRSLDSYYKSFREHWYLFGVMSYYFMPSTLLKLIVYILSSYYLCFRISLIIQHFYAIFHINEKATPQ